ncbi:MAG: hypothetical protein M5R36_20600 [Deltaproteobacteria bacterium]|nr:hypothetical protein [Deltaproteobacteria bacterium]
MAFYKRAVQAVLAPALFIALSVLVGFAAARYYGRDLSALYPPPQGDNHPALGVGNGRAPEIHQLAWHGPRLMAATSDGVYAQSADRVWQPLRDGLPSKTDVRLLSSLASAPIAATDRGDVYLFGPSSWKLIARSPINGPFRWLRGTSEGFLAFADSHLFSWNRSDGAFSHRSFDGISNPATWRRSLVYEAGGTAIKRVDLYIARHGAAILVPRESGDADTPPLMGAPGDPGLYWDAVAPIAVGARDRVIDADLLPSDQRSDFDVAVIFEDTGFGVVSFRGGQAREPVFIRSGLPIAELTAVAAGRRSLYVGTKNRGVYRKIPGPQRFEPANAGLLYIPQ